MMMFAFARHPIVSYSDGHGGTITYYYYDYYTWIVAVLALAWLIWFLVNRYRRRRAMQRPPIRKNYKSLKRVVKIKNQLSARLLQPGSTRTIHAVGIGMLDGTQQYCIQVFLSNPDERIWVGAGATRLPTSYGGFPIVPVLVNEATFFSGAGAATAAQPDEISRGIRKSQKVIIGGISGANTNLTGQSGTLGYFCTRRRKFTRSKEVCMFSCAHTFGDLRKGKIDDTDLIMQPSPGEASSHRPIATLVNYSPLKFNGDINDPNHVDAAVAKLWPLEPHKGLLPFIGSLKGYVPKRDIQVREPVRKVGRTTFYTEGRIVSINLDIWVGYERTGQAALFKDQLLIEPTLPGYTQFARSGDSGSVVVDQKQYAVGLVFGGATELPESLKTTPESPVTAGNKWAGEPLKKIESYGVANPISEVLDRLKIDLLI
jgi:hypothetical protein